jgi:acyl-CoA thioester hydrolase|tara:strand:- start:56 stop:523 length:468 start_codon:yes stop_codon:yes gene_type:complete
VPVYLKSQNIIKEWVDYNNHLNMAYYVLIFDQALEVILEKFNMGAKSAKTEKRSTMVVETNTKYINEVQEGIEIDIFLTFFDHDKKRLHLKMEMVEKKTKKISASIEWLSLYVNLETRKVTEFESEKIIIMDSFIKENKNNFNNENLKLSSKLRK